MAKITREAANAWGDSFKNKGFITINLNILKEKRPDLYKEILKELSSNKNDSVFSKEEK